MKGLLKRGLKIRLTANGWVFLFVAAAIFLLSINYSNNLIFSFCFLLCSIVFVSFWLNLRNITGVTGKSVGADPVHAGQQLEYRFIIENGTTNAKHQLMFERSGEPVDIDAAASLKHRVRYQTQNRGRLPESVIRLHSRWPLDLFDLSIDLCQCPEVLIYPNAAALKPVTFRSEGNQAHLHDSSDELAGLKEYQPGDNLRRAHWKSLAKNDRLVIRQFDGEEGEPSGWLCWDDTESLNDYENRISCLTDWVVDSYSRNREYGLKLPDHSITPGKDSKQLHRCLASLAIMPESGQ